MGKNEKIWLFRWASFHVYSGVRMFKKYFDGNFYLDIEKKFFEKLTSTTLKNVYGKKYLQKIHRIKFLIVKNLKKNHRKRQLKKK